MPLKVLKESKPAQFKKKIAIAAGKGGVGKSSFSTWLAYYFQKQKYLPALLDLDFYGPSLRKMIPPEKNAFTDNQGHHPALSKGIKSLSYSDFKSGEGSSISIRAPLATQLVEEFLYKTVWGDTDILIIDCPPGTSDIHMSLCQKIALDGVILITTPQEISIIDVKKSADFFVKMGVPLLGIVENMGFIKRGEETIPLYSPGGGLRLSEEYKIPLICQIPFLSKLNYYSDCGFNLFDSIDPDFDEIKESITKAFLVIENCDLKVKPEFFTEDPYSFKINWGDEIRHYILSELLLECPCAGCQEIKKDVLPEVRALGIKTVGNYALKIEFIGGCQKGIYPYSWLKKRGEKV